MTMKQAYEEYLVQHAKVAGGHQFEQEKNYVHPFNIYGPIWYVGDSWVCTHLIDTGDGLLLLDAGNCGTTGMLVNAIWEAGFKPSDVKWIIVSHGHYDHFGAVSFFRRMFGTKIYLGAEDAKMFRERPWLAHIQHAHNACDELFVPDVEINDGDVLTFGNITLKCVNCPGHTDGVTSVFFEVDGPEGVKRIGYYGGFGYNTLQKEFLVEMGDTSYKMRDIYLQSLAKVRDEQVDIMLGNHAGNNDTVGRRKQQLENPDGPNPFIEPGYWQKFLDSKRDGLLELMADPKQN